MIATSTGYSPVAALHVPEAPDASSRFAVTDGTMEHAQAIGTSEEHGSGGGGSGGLRRGTLDSAKATPTDQAPAAGAESADASETGVGPATVAQMDAPLGVAGPSEWERTDQSQGHWGVLVWIRNMSL